MENKRVCQTIEEKYKIIKACEAMKVNFGAKSPICRQFNLKCLSTLNTILGKKDEVIENYKKSAVPERKRMRKSVFSEIDEQLYQWFLRTRSNNIELSGDKILQKATEIAEQLGAREEFTASHGFLDGFKNRYGLKFQKKYMDKLVNFLLKLFTNGAQSCIISLSLTNPILKIK